MSEMVRRGAEQLARMTYGTDWERFDDMLKASLISEGEHEFAAALLAAMDEDDDALLKALTDAPTFGKLDVIDAKIILELIKTHAQGERHE